MICDKLSGCLSKKIVENKDYNHTEEIFNEPMLDVLQPICFSIALICFLAFFIPGNSRKYFGIAAWSALIAGFLCMLPDLLFHEGNVFYPVLIILCLPLLYITIRRLLAEDKSIQAFTRGAGIAAVIYAPFSVFEPLGNWLISTVVYWVQQFFHLIDYPFKMYAWNIFESVWFMPGYSYGYRDQIILGCTGITAIAILIGVVFLTQASWRKKLALILLVSVPIYVVNIFRNVFVIMAYFGQWFPWFEAELAHPTIPGFASYFWSHNVMCEGGAFLLIVLIAFLLFKFSPGLISTLRDIVDVYIADLRALVRKR